MTFSNVVTVAIPNALILAGLVVAAIVAVSGHPKLGIRCGLELWMAAGVLRLSSASWSSIAAAAVLVAVRQLVGRSLLAGRGARLGAG